VGPDAFKTLRGLFELLLTGDLPGKQPYAFRVPQPQLVSGITFLQDGLDDIPARSRVVPFEGALLGPLPILAMGSATHKELFLQYCATHPQGARLGRKTFRKLVQVLCCQSKSVSGLSSYYIAFLDLVRNVEAMLARAVDVGGDAVRAGDLLMCLQEHVAFLKYRYGHKHVGAPECDGMEEHCCLPALGGGRCTKPHPGRCGECAMHARVVPSIAAFLLEVLGDEVRDALPVMTEHFTKYRSHKLREAWQRESLAALRRSLVEDPAHLLVVLDHKQKVLPTAHRESQAAYFAKVGRCRVGGCCIDTPPPCWCTPHTRDLHGHHASPPPSSQACPSWVP
jgi:hypothetical protein